jgi:hypothetical protein
MTRNSQENENVQIFALGRGRCPHVVVSGLLSMLFFFCCVLENEEKKKKKKKKDLCDDFRV